MRNNVWYAFLLFISYSNAQEKLIKGKVEADGNYAGGIHIVNLVNEKSAITDDGGRFEILAKPEDLLIFSSFFFEYKRKIIEEEDLKSEPLIIKMISKPYELEAVEIAKYVNITAYELGILKTKPIEYTVAERRLRSGHGTKTDLELEQKTMLVERLGYLYADEYFEDTLKIETDYIMAFKYFCAEFKEFRETVSSKNTTKTTKAIKELALRYNYLQKQETIKE